MPVLVKRYANRKLYNTQTSRYITLKGIADLLEQDEEVRVIDNETGEDITSITLSQILVDTERANRAVPGSLLSGLLQRGEHLYGAFRRGMDEAGEGLEGIQRNVRRLLRREGEGEEGERGDWIAFTPPDLDHMVQRTLERVLRMLPQRSRAGASGRAAAARPARPVAPTASARPPRPPRALRPPRAPTPAGRARRPRGARARRRPPSPGWCGAARR
jgi:polyhydroxyalkanoate synthesis repressor PhaR